MSHPIVHAPRTPRGLLARPASRAARAALRGVSIMEVMIVVAILSLLAAGIGVAVLPKLQQARVDSTRMNARAIRDAVNRWRSRSTEGCPSVSQLVQEKEIDSASKQEDAWGSAYKISCTDDDVAVASPGPDKKEGTPDDIRVP